MAGIKISVPVGGKDSDAFKDSLKVTLAVTAYNTPVEWVKRIQSLARKGDAKGSCEWDGYFGE
jgi:hypothetical protein